jgi:hypothetical protein
MGVKATGSQSQAPQPLCTAADTPVSPTHSPLWPDGGGCPHAIARSVVADVTWRVMMPPVALHEHVAAHGIVESVGQ